MDWTRRESGLRQQAADQGENTTAANDRASIQGDVTAPGAWSAMPDAADVIHVGITRRLANDAVCVGNADCASNICVAPPRPRRRSAQALHLRHVTANTPGRAPAAFVSPPHKR